MTTNCHFVGYLESNFNWYNHTKMDRTCEKCGKLFDMPYLLKRHIERKTPCQRDTTEVQNRYSCDRCEKSFSLASSLSRHKTKCVASPEKTDEITEHLQKQAESMKQLQSQVETLLSLAQMRKEDPAMMLTTQQAVISEPTAPKLARTNEMTPSGSIATLTQTRVRKLTRVTEIEEEVEETKLEWIPWDGPEPSCIVVTTKQIAKAFEENPVLQEYASLHHDEMTDPKRAPDYVVELFIDLIKRGHEASEARNIYLSPNRADQVKIHLRTGAWEVHELSSVSRTLLESIASAMKRTTLRDEERKALPMDAQEALAWAGMHYGASPALYAKAIQKPLAAHLTNLAPFKRTNKDN
jgi:hypothetical protein